LVSCTVAQLLSMATCSLLISFALFVCVLGMRPFPLSSTHAMVAGASKKHPPAKQHIYVLRCIGMHMEGCGL
jgi:hypothetical protein